MKKFLLIVLTMLGGTLCSQAADWGTTKTALDTMVNAKIVKWSQSVPKDSVALTFYGVANSYGNSFKPTYSTGSGGTGSTGTSTIDLSSLLGGGGASKNDTLVVTRASDNKEQYVAEDTIYFKGPLDKKRQQFKDSIFVTRLSHYMYVKGTTAQFEDADNDPNTITISVKDAGTIKIYAVPATEKQTKLWFRDKPNVWSGSEMSLNTQQATLNWNNFGESVVNYNLSNPPAGMTFEMGGSTGGTGSTGTPGTTAAKDTTLNCYEIFYFQVKQGEYTIHFDEDAKLYGIELLRASTQQDMIDFPDNGTDNLILGDGVDIDVPKLEANTKAYSVLAFNIKSGNASIELVSLENGFKKGDVIKIAGAYRDNNEKVAKFDIQTTEGKSKRVIFTTSQLVNGKTDPSAPTVETFTLMQDADDLYIEPTFDTNTTPYLTKLQVIRASETDKSYRQGPKLISKVIRWKEEVAAGSLADEYTSMDNSYANPKTSTGGGRGGKTKEVPDGAPSDTLKMSRVDADKVQSLVCDTVFFRSSVDPCSNHYKDSIYVTRFTHYLNTTAASDQKNYLKLNLMTEGTLKIYARPVDGAAADRTILVTQGDREVINVALAADGDKGTEKVNTDAFSSTHNYNLANPPKTSSGTTVGKTSSSTPTNVAVYPVLYSRVDAGELTLEYPAGAVEIYGIELVMVDQSGLKALIDFPDDSSDGIIKNGAKMDMVTPKSGSAITCYKFDGPRDKKSVELEVEGGFKSGDVIKIGGFINESTNQKGGKLILYSMDDGEYFALIATTDQLVNVKTDTNKPFVETFTLGNDYQTLYIARSDDSEITCYLSIVKVLGDRSNEETAQIRALHRQNRALYYGDGDATGIRTIKATPIDESLYNLSGQRVSSDYKGVVIQNGRKLIKK